MSRKYLLGLHHLNIAYCSGNIASYHRQVRESVMPLLNLLKNHPAWCFSIEMCGASVEFIGTNYPAVLTELRFLILNGQVEFISSIYAPQIWIQFPEADLFRSIEINQQVLKNYEINASRIFFSQENFICPGIEKLSQWFDAVLVKDDYFFYYGLRSSAEEIPPYYQVGNIKLVVGWATPNYILIRG